MLDREVADEVQVDVRRDVDGVFLDAECRVVHDIQVTRESVTLRVNRHKRQVNTRVAVHHDRVHDIILIERHCQRRRQRRHKPVEQQVHVVVVDIYVLEDRIDVLLERTRRHQVFHAEDTFLLQNLLLAVRLALVVFLVQVLADTDRHTRIDARRIDILLDEREVLPERFVPVDLDVIQRKRHARVTLRRVLIHRLHARRILVRYHFLDQLYRRVAFAFVLALAVLGRHHNVLQSIYVRRHLHLRVFAVLPLAQGEHLRLEAQHLEVQRVVTSRVADCEVAIYIRSRPHLRGNHAFVRRGLEEVYLHERQTLARIGINHLTRYTCALGCILRHNPARYSAQHT